MSSTPPQLDCRAIALTVSAVIVAVVAIVGIVNPPLSVALVAENSAAEWVQVLLMAGTGTLAAGHGWAASRAGRSAVLEVAIVTAMVMACVSEIDLDRMLFGIKLVKTKFLVNPKYPLALRALAALVIVGGPVAVGVWLLTRWRLLRDVARAAVRQPWGQTAAAGAMLYAVTQVLERPIDSIPWQQHHMIEETFELVATLCMFVGLAARRQRVTLSPGRPAP
jgi:hypothetical protein